MDLRGLRYFVAVAEERHIGRAAARLHMTQPPLSRAMRALADELGVVLLERTSTGVALTQAGRTLHGEAVALLEQADRIAAKVRSGADARRLSVGSLADAVELIGARLVPAFRRRHPDVSVSVHETDLSDPSAGLRCGLVDVALTRLPFDDAGLHTHVLHTERVGVVVRDDDPLAGRDCVDVADLVDRDWIRLPPGADPVWTAYWTGPSRPDASDPPLRTIQECLQAVLWSGRSALAPVDQVLPPGLVTVPAGDRDPSRLVLAWPAVDASPLVRSFVRVAAEAYRPDAGAPTS